MGIDHSERGRGEEEGTKRSDKENRGRERKGLGERERECARVCGFVWVCVCVCKMEVRRGARGRGGGGTSHTQVLPIRVHQPLKWTLMAYRIVSEMTLKAYVSHIFQKMDPNGVCKKTSKPVELKRHLLEEKKLRSVLEKHPFVRKTSTTPYSWKTPFRLFFLRSQSS